jgi:Arc/MetJ-type ribon-helix-helix transcriptional regulator
MGSKLSDILSGSASDAGKMVSCSCSSGEIERIEDLVAILHRDGKISNRSDFVRAAVLDACEQAEAAMGGREVVQAEASGIERPQRGRPKK